SIAGFRQLEGRRRYLPDIEQTSDGFVGFTVVTRQHWQDFCVLIEQPDWADDESLATLANRMQRSYELGGVIHEWMRTRSTEEVVAAASLLRIPVAAVESGATIARLPHLVEAGKFRRDAENGVVTPTQYFVVTPGDADSALPPRPAQPAPTLGPPVAALPATARKPPVGLRRKLPFEGLRIAEFAAYFAGPLVGHFFALLGAEVIHVESTTRPDGWRGMTWKKASEPQWWEWSPVFHAVNTNKLGVTIDLDRPRGHELALDLVKHCDVVLENYSPRVMERFGLTYEALRHVRPDLLMVRMPAFGLSGPWRDRTAYAMTVEQASGMSWLSGFSDSQPENPNGPCDPIAGLHAAYALMLGLEHRRRTGEGVHLEVPMIGSALNVTSEQVIEYSAHGHVLTRDGNHGAAAAPQNLYLAADVDDAGTSDRWVALAVETNQQWHALRKGLGDPAWAANPNFDSFDGRRAAQTELDTHLADWCRSHLSDEIVNRLWPLGVPVAKVINCFELTDIPQLQARGFFETVIHPVTGSSTHIGFPIQFSSGPDQWNRSPSPTLGQHNRYVFEDIVGLTCEDVDKLERDSVIGYAP
ncbi:MAG: CoA transferase, partial [Acidimicrobiales bacterium]